MTQNQRRAVLPLHFSKPIGKYVPGMLVSLNQTQSLLFISGQVATDELGNTIGIDDPEIQARKVFANILKVIETAGGKLEDLVSITIYVIDIKDFQKISKVRDELFANHAPSSTLVEVKGLAQKEHLVEISAIAMI